MKLVTVAQMCEFEKKADAGGLSYAEMLERAGRGLAEHIRHFAEVMPDEPQILGLVGAGNNGGDTLVALAELAADGFAVTAYLTAARQRTDGYVQRLVKAGGEIVRMEEDGNFARLDELLEEADLLLDGVLGTGYKPPMKPTLVDLLKHVIALGDYPMVIAVDCPSGVDCETGELAEAVIPAKLTVCMGAIKAGLLKLPAFEKVGVLTTVDLGFPEDLAGWAEVNQCVANGACVSRLLPNRPRGAHKGTFGCAMVVAGSINYTGAVFLAGSAAYRSGAGLVRLAVPAPLHTALAGNLPEATWLILPHEVGVIAESAANVLLKNLDKVTAMLIGPGLGQEETTGAFIRAILTGDNGRAGRGALGFVTQARERDDADDTKSLPPLVVDADGLRWLALIAEWWKLLPGQTILTPHPGEMAALTGLTVDEIQANREEVAAKYAKQWGCAVILKGALTVVAGKDGKVTVIPVATAALAKAGTGDVLAGMAVGLLAQGVQAEAAAVSAAWIHGQAGILAEATHKNPFTVNASDVLDALPQVFELLG